MNPYPFSDCIRSVFGERHWPEVRESVNNVGRTVKSTRVNNHGMPSLPNFPGSHGKPFQGYQFASQCPPYYPQFPPGFPMNCFYNIPGQMPYHGAYNMQSNFSGNPQQQGQQQSAPNNTPSQAGGPQSTAQNVGSFVKLEYSFLFIWRRGRRWNCPYTLQFCGDFTD